MTSSASSSSDRDTVERLLSLTGRPFAESLKGLPATRTVQAVWGAGASCEALLEAAEAWTLDGPAAAADAALCSTVYLWLTGLACHPLGARAVAAATDGVDAAAGGSAQAVRGNPFLRVFTSATAAYAEAFRGYVADGDGRIPLSVLNAFSRTSVDLKRAWAWSVPSEAALDKLAALGPLFEVGAGTGYWGGVLAARGVDVVCYDSSATWLAEHNEGETGDLCAVETGFVARVSGGPEAAGLPENQGKALVLMWPDFMGKGTFGLDAVRRYTGETLALVGEWADATLGVYTDGLQPTGQSFSPAFQSYVQRTFEKVDDVALPAWPLYGDKLTVWKRRAEAVPSAWDVRHSDVLGRYMVAARALEARSEIVQEEPVLRVQTAHKEGAKFAAMHDAAVSGEGGLARFYEKGLQVTGGCAGLRDGMRAMLAEAGSGGYADGGARAGEVENAVAVAACFHYNGFGGIVGDSGELRLKVFPTISLCNHSCSPNAAVSPAKGLLSSLAPVAAGEGITISYLDEPLMLAPRAKRRAFLEDRWGFVCLCERCTLPYDTQKVFTLPEAAGEGEAGEVFAFTDDDGDAVAVRADVERAGIVYSIDGEDRPLSRHLSFDGSQGTIDFPDVDRSVPVPAHLITSDNLMLLRRLAAAAAVRCDGLPMTRAMFEASTCRGCESSHAAVFDDGVLRCAACRAERADSAEAAALAETLVKAEKEVEALLAAEEEWTGAQAREAQAFALSHQRHHASYAVLERLVGTSAYAQDVTVHCALARTALALAGWGEAAEASVASHLADVHGTWAEVAFKSDMEDKGSEAVNKQYMYRQMNDVVDPAWANVADCQPNAQVLAFLYKD